MAVPLPEPSSSSLKPACRTAVISNLIETVDRYNPSNCHILEDYLSQQMQDGTYDHIANLALIKLFQVNPQIISTHSVLSVLLLSVVHAPFAPDFLLLTALLGDSFLFGGLLPPVAPSDAASDDSNAELVPAAPNGEREVGEKITALSSLLQSRKMGEFWAAWNTPEETDEALKAGEASSIWKALKEDLPNAETILRSRIAQEVALSFRSISLPTFTRFTGLPADSSDLSALATAQGWAVDGSKVQLPQNESNTPKPSVTKDKVEIEQLGRLLSKS